MGCDCKIHLPGNVRVRDVAELIGILVGKKSTLETMQGGYLTIKVEGVKVETTCVPEMVQISVAGPLSDDAVRVRPEQNPANGCFAYYHFEEEGKYIGMRCLNPRSTPFWIAIGKALVDFFGGEVDFNDCDSTDVDHKRKHRSNEENCPSDGKPWDEFQRRMAAVSPLTLNDFIWSNTKAGYKMDDR